MLSVDVFNKLFKAFFGNIGQADYAMANEVLNKAAYQIKHDNPECHVISINWGPWDSGMVTPELKRAFSERKIDLIPSDAGAELLVKEITTQQRDFNQAVQIVVGNLPPRPVINISTELHHFEIRRHLSLKANPFLLDHRIGPHPVMPATCAASWVTSMGEQLYPGFTLHLIEDFKVLKGIVFDESIAQEHILNIKEVEKVLGEKVTFSALIESKNKNGSPLYHYSLSVTLLHEIPPFTIHKLPSPPPVKKQGSIPGENLYKDGTLFHGPSFQGVKRVLEIGESNLLMECKLPPISTNQQGQFIFQTANPFIYDTIVQSLLIWTQKNYQSPCLPSHLVSLYQYRVIPFNKQFMVDMQIVSHNETAVIADIWVINEKGEVYVKFERLQGTISSSLKRFIGIQTTSTLTGQ